MLSEPQTMLDADFIKAACESALGQAGGVHYFASLPSTNAWLQERCKEFAGPQLCITDQQTAGRGRRGKTWQSPQHGVTFSLLRQFNLPAAQLSGLSLVTGIAIVQTLRSFGAQAVKLKWPNDVLHQQKKLGGILIEMNSAANNDNDTATDLATDTISGIGLNYAGAGDAAQIEQPFTDLGSILDNKLPAREQLIASISKSVLAAYADYEMNGFAPFRAMWESYDAFAGQEIRVTCADGKFIEGAASGIADSGALRLHTADGVQTFHAGEVSVRKAQ